MKIDEWVIREVIDTLHQANITLLGITGLDSPREFAKKSTENETAINRRTETQNETRSPRRQTSWNNNGAYRV